MKKAELKKKLAEIIDEMSKLEVEMARTSHEKGVSVSDVAVWVGKSTTLSSKLDKIWKEL
jgi:hypothetical protein